MSRATPADSPLAAFVPELVRGWREPVPGAMAVEGTLLFADVSGFTRLTEKLARRGRVGAEEVVNVISSVWEALLSASSVDGGDVLKFAGDALFVFFDGPDHASRACHAALAMKRELARVGRVETGSGPVRLRMAVGIHSGDFHFCVVGGDHLELLVVGAAATATVEMERLAGAGQVLVSPATAALCDRARLLPSSGAGMLLRDIAPPVPSAHATAEPAIPLERFVSPLLRNRLGSTEHEHRRATVAFAEIGGLDRTLRDQDPVEAFDRLNSLACAVMDLLVEHDILLTSTDVGHDGAVLMMTAGAPDSTGDEEARMLRVARRIVELDTAWKLRVGVNAGNVFVGEVGPLSRRAYVTMGDTTNVAARVMTSAPWGEALATRAVLVPSGARFSTRPVPAFSVKGKKALIEAAVLEGELETTLRLPPPTGDLIGRDHELDVLVRALAESRQGHGQVVEITAPEGTGKSRLVAELRLLATDANWHAIVCDPFEKTVPYRSARLLLRQVLGIDVDATPVEAGDRLSSLVAGLAPHLSPWAPLLALPLGAAADETVAAGEVSARFRRVRAQQVMVDLVEAVATKPTVLAVEDASNMDDASAEMVAELLARLQNTPWLAVITRTESETGLHRGRGYRPTMLELAPLSSHHATELAMRLAEHTPVPPHLLGGLVERSGGNPLFLAELVARAGTGSSELPHSIEGIIAARIDELDPGDRRVLRYLSVLGERFEVSTAAETLSDLAIDTDDPQLWQRLEGFVEKTSDTVTFTNPLVRQVAYESLTYRWRREIHSRVADVLVDDRDDQLPFHLATAERWSEAWTTASKAGNRARRAGANAVAGELYALALNASRHLHPPPPELAEIAARAGEVWARAGVGDRALEAYGLAISSEQNDSRRVLLAAHRAGVHEKAGRYPQALGLYARALTEATEIGDPIDRSRCLAVLHAGYASTRHRQGRHQEAIEHAEKALAHSTEAGDQETLAYSHHLLDRLHTVVGDRDTALRHRDAALPIFAELGDLAAQGTVLHDLAADAHRGGRLEEAAWLYERAIDARTRAGDVERAAASINALGEVDLAGGERERAGKRFGEALRIWRGARSPEGVALASGNLGWLRMTEGDNDEALARLEDAEEAALSIGAESLLPDTRLRLAESYGKLGRHVESWDMATWVLHNSADPPRQVMAHRLRAASLTATGGFPRATAELERAREVAKQAGLYADDQVDPGS